MGRFKIEKVVSGGQTGVDRVALDVAIFKEIPHGGWCPKGRRSEDGRIPEVYQLKETDAFDYSVRTEQNVVQSDGTLILYLDQLSGGTRLTRNLANKLKRPLQCVDLGDAERLEQRLKEVVGWLVEENVRVLNVAGPRASSQPDISKRAESFLLAVIQDLE